MNGSEPYLILGIGNSLLTDDGVGIHAVRLLGQDPPPHTVVVDGGTDFLGMIPHLEAAAKVLVIDAMEAGESPGTLYRCRAEDLAKPAPSHSLHELGLLSVLEFIEPSRRPEIHVLGVQPARIDYSTDLSSELAQALPRVAAAARRLVAEFSGNSAAKA